MKTKFEYGVGPLFAGAIFIAAMLRCWFVNGPNWIFVLEAIGLWIAAGLVALCCCARKKEVPTSFFSRVLMIGFGLVTLILVAFSTEEEKDSSPKPNNEGPGSFVTRHCDYYVNDRPVHPPTKRRKDFLTEL